MKSLALLLLCLATATAQAQTNVRVRGTITALNGDTLMVKTREGRDIALHLAPDAQVVTTKKVTADEFKPGSYVGVTSVKGPDGRLVAKRVHALGPQVPQMHAPWDSMPELDHDERQHRQQRRCERRQRAHAQVQGRRAEDPGARPRPSTTTSRPAPAPT